MTSMALALLLMTTYRLEWRDLPQQVLDRKVSLTTTDGVKLKGRVLAFEEEGMRMRVTGTSDRRLFPKGDRMVPRGAITRLRVDKTAGRTWRVVGAVIAGSLGAAGAIPVILIGAEPAMGAAAIAVGTGLGYLFGWAADRKVIEIVTE